MDFVNHYKKEILPRMDLLRELSALEPVKKGGGYYSLNCPKCGKKEAYAYRETGFIICNRKNNCGHQQSVLAYLNDGDEPRGKTFLELVKDLGKRYGAPMDEAKFTEHLKICAREKNDQELLNKVWKHCTSLLPKNDAAINFLKKRKLPTSLGLFGVYPTTADLEEWLRKEQLDISRCYDLGLIRKDFEGRLIGDWRTRDNEICNFWARSLDGTEPKYTRLKTHPDLRQEYPHGCERLKGERAIWVEGHLDVISAHLSGLKNVVGCSTSSAPKKALETLKIKEAILCIDNDHAGQKGAYKFIEKYRNDDLKIFVAKIPYAECKDLCDVYEKHGEEAVQGLVKEENLTHGMTFVAEYITQKHRGEGWNDYNKTQAVSALTTFCEKVSAKKSWMMSAFFWPRVIKELDLDAEDIGVLASSIEEKKNKEWEREQAKKELNSALNLFENGNNDQGKKAIDEFNQKMRSQSIQTDLVRELLEPSTKDELVREFQEMRDNLETGYDFSQDVKIEFPAGAITAITAPTGHGKTRALINFCLGILGNHPEKSIYFFTYEQSESAITSLFLNTYINEEFSKNNRRSLDHYFRNIDEEEERFKYFIKGKTIPIDGGQDQPIEEYFLEKEEQFFKELIESGRLKIVYCDYNAQDLFKAVHHLKEKKDNLGLICIDYVQLLNDADDKNKMSRQEQLKGICLKMKNCAVETGLPIVIAAQFNREVKDKEDMHATKIGEAGDIERIANLIIGIYDLHEEKKLHIEVLKGRDIGTGHKAEFPYNGNTGRISNDQEQDTPYRTLG